MSLLKKLKKAARKLDKKLGIQATVRKAVMAASKGKPWENLAKAATKASVTDPARSMGRILSAAAKDAPGLAAAYFSGGTSMLGKMALNAVKKGKSSVASDVRARLPDPEPETEPEPLLMPAAPQSIRVSRSTRTRRPRGRAKYLR